MNECLPHCLCGYLSSELSRSVCFSLSLRVSQSLAVSLCVALPRFSQASAPPMGQSQLAPTPTPTSQELPGGAQLPHSQTSGHSWEGGWARLLRPSSGQCPLPPPPQALLASGRVGASQGRRAGGWGLGWVSWEGVPGGRTELRPRVAPWEFPRLLSPLCLGEIEPLLPAPKKGKRSQWDRRPA